MPISITFAQGASDLYYTKATGVLEQEAASYVAMLDALLTTGSPAPGAAGFTCTVPEANTPLFDPWLAAQRTVSGVLAGNVACPEPVPSDVEVYAGSGTITNPLSDAGTTINHLNAILDTPPGAGLTLDVSGGSLTSQGIPPLAVSGTTAPALAFTPSPERAAWINDVEGHAIQTIGVMNVADDVTARLLGSPTTAQQLAWSIWGYADETLQSEPNEIREFRAAFGIYGSLPVLAVFFDEGFILVDGLTGEVTGPYADDQPFDPVPLLLNHPEYEPGTPASMLVAGSNCEAVGGKRWRARPPRHYTPKAPEIVPCPTPEDPNQMCPAPPVPYIPPVPPLHWPDHFYPYEPQEHPLHPFPIPDVPDSTWRTNPGVEGNPTDWSCKTPQSLIGIPVEFCATITTSCAPSGSPCVPRLIICVFSHIVDGTPTHKNRTSPRPGTDYPEWPNPIIFRDHNGNPNQCYDRYYY